MDSNHGETQQPRINEVAQKFVADLEEERQRLGDSFPLCSLLIEEAIERIYITGRIPGKEFYADVLKQKPLKIAQKVFVPIKQYPKFNFTGKLLGPKGNSLRRLQEETQCKIVIKGRGSMRDRAKEEELRNSDDMRYAHLHKDLHLEISTLATPAEGYARIAYALAEIRKYLIPDKNDEVSHGQLREMMEMDPESVKNVHGPKLEAVRSVFERKLNMNSGTTKYLNLLQHVQETDGYENDLNEIQQGDTITGYAHKFVKARPSTAAAVTYKRPSASAYTPDKKRLRPTAVKSILNKYK